MDADWSVELGHDDPALDFPWSSSNGSKGYVDLLQRPELLSAISEATQYPELGEFLLTLNAPSSHWLTVKCDVWLDHQLGEAEGIYGATMRQSSYVDLILAIPRHASRLSATSGGRNRQRAGFPAKTRSPSVASSSCDAAGITRNQVAIPRARRPRPQMTTLLLAFT